MANTTVNIDIKVEDKDLQALESTLKDLNIGFSKADDTLGELGKSIDSVAEGLSSVGVESGVFSEIEDSANKAVTGVKKFEKGVESAGKETAKVGKEATIFDDIGDRFNDMTKGIRKVIVSMKTLKGAIAATGIGALVIALGSLVAYFKSSEEGSRKLAIATETLSLLFGKLTEFLSGLGEKLISVFSDPKQALIDFKDAFVANIVERFNSFIDTLGFLASAVKKVFQGDFSGALEDTKNAGKEMVDVFTGVPNTLDKVAETGKKVFAEVKTAIAEATVTATQLVDATRAYRDLNQELIVQNAELNQDLEEQRKIAEDTTLTFEERKAALEEVGRIQVQLAENVAKQAKAEEDLLKTQIANEKNYEKREELETQLAEATAARIDAQTQLSIVELEAGKLGRELDLEEVARKKEINDILKELGLEQIEDQFELARQELEIQKQKLLDELVLKKASAEEIAKVEKAFSEKSKQLAKEELDYKKELKKKELDTNLAAASAALGAIQSIVGEDAAEGKALAIAQATIDTFRAANGVIAETKGGSFARIAGMIAVITAGLANVAAIANTKIPGQPDSGGMGAPSAGGLNLGRIGAIDTGAVEFAETGTPEITTTQPAIQTYVLAGSVTSAQEANAKLSTRRNIG
jgi:hypothetical protein